jgi:hypothetical protein
MAEPLVVVDNRAMLDLGTEMIGFSKRAHEQKKIEHFCASFGIEPNTCSIIFHDLQTVDIGNARIENIDPYFFLMTLYWLRHYTTNDVLAGIFRINRKTFSKWVWVYTYGIQALKETKVSTKYLFKCMNHGD